MYARLGLGLYGAYIGIYGDIEACTQKRSQYTYIYIYIYIYIYTRLNLGVQAKSSPHAAQYGYRKL